jgi:hypothetical protein
MFVSQMEMEMVTLCFVGAVPARARAAGMGVKDVSLTLT